MLLMLGYRVPNVRKERARIRMSLTHSSGTFLADVSRVSSWARTKALLSAQCIRLTNS
jgi:hypothetical protein